MNSLTVREYARLTTEDVCASGLDCAHITPADFDELCAFNEARQTGEAPLLRQESRTSLRLRHYVGVLELKSGTRIEILPKTCSLTDSSTLLQERGLLIRMLSAALGVSPREGSPSSIERFPAPLSEWIIRQFLLELHLLLKKGLRFGYQQVDEERPYLRGQLDMRRQIVQPLHRQHLLHIRHTVFSSNRPEHRLLRLALDRCTGSSQNAENIRLAAPLRTLLDLIPPSFNARDDFRQWSEARHMAHYLPVRPWCELILGSRMPFALVGAWRGISMLFPMEKLFENYVAACLRKQLMPNAALKSQAGGYSLCRLEDQNFFALRPDILIFREGQAHVLDTKWKKLSANKKDHFGISQQDIYQMFAYGHTCGDSRGDMALIYPRHDGFPTLESPFQFSDQLRLWILGWDLHNDSLILPDACPLRSLFR